MPIPVHANHYYVIVDMASGTGLDATHWSNTFFFENEGTPMSLADAADDIQVLLDKFYGQVNSPGTNRLCIYFSKWIDPSASSYKVYDLGDAAPRTPDVHTGLSWGAGVGPAALPNECSGVLSYRGDAGGAGGGTLDKTKRGRLFLGPLSTAAIEDGSTSHPDQILSSGFVAAMRGAGSYLINQTDNDFVWQQYSRKDDDFEPVQGGFVENAADTQRRRGLGATARFTYS